LDSASAASGEAPARIAVLFSGGIDCSVVARLAHECVPAEEAIELINVCFLRSAGGKAATSPATESPDRLSARASLKDLQAACPKRVWRLIEADWSASAVVAARPHIRALLGPNNTVMDESIGGAIWFAAQGIGYVQEEAVADPADGRAGRHLVRSRVRVLLSGQSADEILGGYARHLSSVKPAEADEHASSTASHETVYERLREALVQDQRRLWRRNLGRDDRIVSDTGRELRAPFLDVEVLRTAARIPLDALVLEGQPRGVAEKAVLREIAAFLGLHHSAGLPKRAIQFGSRLAKQLNKLAAAEAGGSVGKIKGNHHL
jgi:asparagine synthetase B (glutamine-hydrolysing)